MNGRRALSRHSQIPWMLVLSMLGLVGIGLAAIARGDELAGGQMVTRQAMWTVLAGIGFLVAATIPYRFWKPWSSLLYAGSVVLLLVVLFLPAKYGSRRWIPLGVVNLQPSELAKLAYIFMLGHHLMYERNHRTIRGLLSPFLLTLLPVVLILREPDLGTAMLFFPIFFAMLFAAGARTRHLLLTAVCGLACVPMMWKVMSAEQRSRVTTLFQQSDGGDAPTGDGYHLHQAKQVLALGGLSGSRIEGQVVGDAAAYRLPASRTDFVFCIIGEHWGLVGNIGVLCLILVVIGRGLMIAAGTKEPFGRLISVGIVALLGSQAAINAGMTVGLMPITGLTFPFVSYGGSSLVATAAAMGLLVNVALRPGYEISRDPFVFERLPG